MKKNRCDIMNDKNIYTYIFILSSVIIPIIIAYIFISYVDSIERNAKNCKCAQDIRTKYIRFYGYFIIIFTIVNLFMILFYRILKINLIYIIKILSIIIGVLGIYTLYSYSKILNEKKCDCSNNWKKIFIKYYSYIGLFILAITFFTFLLLFIYCVFTGNEKELKKINTTFYTLC